MYRLWFGRLLWFGRSVNNLSIRSFPTKQARSDAALDGANERVLALIPHSLRSFRNFHFGPETTGSIMPIASELADAVLRYSSGLMLTQPPCKVIPQGSLSKSRTQVK